MTRQPGHITDNVALLRQGLTAIAIVGPDLYGGVSGTNSMSPIGAHFRHVFDHYRAFLNGVSTGKLNYDVRERDPLVERDLAAASQTARSIMAQLEEISDQQVLLSIEVSAVEFGPELHVPRVRKAHDSRQFTPFHPEACTSPARTGKLTRSPEHAMRPRQLCWVDVCGTTQR